MNERDAEMHRRLEELEAKIEEKKKTLAEHRDLGSQLRLEWDRMLRHHSDIRRRLQDGHAKGSTEAAATLREDIDVLRHAFFRWAAQVDDRYKGPK